MIHAPARIRVGFFAALLVAASVGGPPAIAGGEPECVSVTAWDRKVARKSRRDALLELARTRALYDIAARAWSRSLILSRSTVSRTVQGSSERQDDWRFTESETILRTVLERFRVEEELRGGSYRYVGDKLHKVVTYCVESERFEAARVNLRSEYDRQIRLLGNRLADLERAVVHREMDRAASLLPGLRTDVRLLVAGDVQVTSTDSGRTQSLHAWLLDVGERVSQGSGVAYDWTTEARDWIRRGHLALATDCLDRAQAADRNYRRAIQLRRVIEAEYGRREAILAHSQKLAAVGRFHAAGRQLARAEGIDDDEASLEQTRKTIQSLRIDYLHYNPRIGLDLFAGLGSLAANENLTADRVRDVLGYDVSGEIPFLFGLGFRARLGRHFLFRTSAGMGLSRIRDDRSSVLTDDRFFDLTQFTAGLGFRTVRRASRPMSFQISAGAAHEAASVNVAAPDGVDPADSRQGLYARLDFAWRSASLFVQGGFGFENAERDPVSLLGWSDRYQIGVTLRLF